MRNVGLSKRSPLSDVIGGLSRNIRVRFGETYPWLCANDPRYASIVSTAGVGTAMVLIVSFYGPELSADTVDEIVSELSGGSALLADMTSALVSGLSRREDLPVAVGRWVLEHLQIPQQIRRLNAVSDRAIGEFVVDSVARLSYEIAVNLRRANRG